MVGTLPVSMIHLDLCNSALESSEEEEGLAGVLWD